MFEADDTDFSSATPATRLDMIKDQIPRDIIRKGIDAIGRRDSQTPDDLNDPKLFGLHGRLLGHYSHELDRQADNRLEMALDEDIYDHKHYTEEELATLRERGQPVITYNVTQTSVNWVLGTQRRSPMDYRILPRRKDGQKAAQRKSELLKHLGDMNRSEYEVSLAFASAVKAGLGWLECGQGSAAEGVKVYDRAEDWRFMLWDSTSRRADILDARYVFRTKWLDMDVATALWPSRRGLIQASASSNALGTFSFGTDELGDEPMDSQEWEHFASASGQVRQHNYAATRHRLRVIEAWFKIPVKARVTMRGGQFNGEAFDEYSPGHWMDLSKGFSTLAITPGEQIFCAILTDSGFLDLRRSPHRHNRYPFTPVWGYRRASDGMPYGMIRGIRDMQRSMNRSISKAHHNLATTRVIAEKGAVEDIDELRAEAGRPDAVIIYEKGFMAPRVERELQHATAHLEMASRDQAMIQMVGGVTDENLGRRTNATSGIAIERRQSQGQLSTALFFENLRLARMIHGEKLMVCIETHYSEQDEFRITDARGNPDFKTINDGNPENSIAEFKADFVVSEEDWRATARQAQAEQLFDLAGKLAATAPMLVIKILDLVVEASDIPKRDEIVKRIRQIAQVDDPDADPDNPDDETLARKAAEAEMAAMAKRDAEAGIRKKENDADLVAAKAAKERLGLKNTQIETLKAAMEAAIAVAGAQAVAHAADQVLINAESVARAEMGVAQPQPSMPPQAPQMPATPAGIPMAPPQPV